MGRKKDMKKQETEKIIEKEKKDEVGRITKEEKNQGLEIAKKAIIKKYGDVISILKDHGDMNIETISSGSISLDVALGRGGFGRGRIYEIFGPNSSGKTTLAINVIIEAQKRGLTACMIDAEHAVDPILLKNYGVNINDLIIIQGFDGEGNIDALETLLKSGAMDVAVVDSVSSLIPRQEAESDVDKDTMAVLARLMSKALRRLTPLTNQTNTLLIFINQLRMKIGSYGCFHYDTQINFVDGKSLPIGEVVGGKIKGKVWTFNEDTNEFEASRITGWHDNGFVNVYKDFLHIQTDSINGGGRFGFTCTVNHKILTRCGWKKASELSYDDKLISRYESGIIFDYVNIREIRYASDRQMKNKHKFDISVEKNNNYMVGGKHNGIVVHNSPEITSGGESMGFYTTGRISVRGPEAKKRRIIDKITGEVVGHETIFEVVKNKLSSPFRKASIKLIYGEGYDKHNEVLDIAVSLGIIDRSGAWYKYNDKNFAQGEDKAVLYFKENIEFYEKIRNKVIEAVGLKEFYERTS